MIFLRKQILITIIFAFLSMFQVLKAQVTSDKYVHDFGKVTEDSSRTVDFILHNESSKKVSPYYFGFSLDVSTQMSAYSIEPDSSIIFRAKVNTDQLGELEEKMVISFWDSDDSIVLTVKANVLSFKYDQNYPLDAFDPPVQENGEDNININVDFKIVDSKDKSVIPNARVSMNSNYLPYKNLVTNENGEVTRTVNNSYSISITASGYKYYNGDINIACGDSVRVIELEKFESHSTDGITEATKQSMEDEKTIDEVISLLDDEPLTAPLDNRFKSNNIVFLLDISYSMLEHKRIELLKTSLINMIKILRPEDRVAVITFNTKTDIFIHPTLATEKNIREMTYKIKKIKANGLTNGGQGLKMAYDFIDEHFQEEANNQVILSTDGGLNSYIKHDDVLSMVSSHEEVKTSIILLKGYAWSVKYMSEISEAGKGHLLLIDNHNIAKTMLIKEIKSNSYVSEE